MWLRAEDPAWDTSSFVISRARSRLGSLDLWLRGQDPGCVASWSRFRLGYTSRFVTSWSRSRLGYLKFVASWSGSRLGYLQFCGFVVSIPVGIPEVVWLRGQDFGWDTSRIPGILQVLWLRCQDPGWDTSNFVASARLGYLKFVVSRSRSRLGYLKFGFVVKTGWDLGFAVKIPVGTPQVCGFAFKLPVGIRQVL